MSTTPDNPTPIHAQTLSTPQSALWGTGGSLALPTALDMPSDDARSALAKIATDTKMVQQGTSPEHSINLLAVYADQLANNMIVGKTALQTVNARIAAIDQLISQQMDQILHDPNFQKLEGAWRGLQYLVKNTDTGAMMKLRLLNATKKELADDFDKATDFDQSALFKKVYEEEYGTFGGYPFSVLVGDYSFGRSAGDMALLTNFSAVAAAAHAPFLSAADPKLFDMASFAELSKPRDLAKQFDSSELIKWKSFRESEDSRYVALTLPRVLMRMPYGDNFTPVESFSYTETVTGPDNGKFLWGNSAYALAQRITAAFSLYHWCAAIRGVEGGGLIEGLPTYTFKTADGLVTLTCPTETAITDRRENELSKLGFIALCHKKNTDQAVFFGGQTVNKPVLYDLDDANANAALSARLPYILATSRFAHYIKVIMRDKIGSFATKENVSNYLNQWLAGSILLNDDAPQAVKAAYPLREGRVDVFDEPGKPGSYRAVVYLRPHFQLEELTVSMRLVADLPAPAK
jgi:type VI secretion system protein ImpC